MKKNTGSRIILSAGFVFPGYVIPQDPGVRQLCGNLMPLLLRGLLSMSGTVLYFFFCIHQWPSGIRTAHLTSGLLRRSFDHRIFVCRVLVVALSRTSVCPERFSCGPRFCAVLLWAFHPYLFKLLNVKRLLVF